MKNNILLITTLAIFLLASCKSDGNSQNTAKNTAKNTDVTTEMNKAVDKTLGKTATQFDGKLDQLLTLDMAVAATGYNAAEAKAKYSKILKSPATHSMRYSWKKGRKEYFKQLKRELEVDDYVELVWVKSTNLNTFKKNYHTPTAEEIEAADKAVNKAMAEKVQSGSITKEQAGIGDGIAKSFMKNLSYTEIPNLGEYAVWNNKDKTLKTYYKGLEFEIRCAVSADEAANREKSIAVAKMIVEQKLK
jgi:hypothetical protein